MKITKSVSLDIHEIQKDVINIINIDSQLSEIGYNQDSLLEIKTLISKDFELLEIIDQIDNLFLFELVNNIHQYYLICRKNFNSITLLSPELNSIKRRLKSYQNNLLIIKKVKFNKCPECGIEYLYKNKQYVCENCNNIRGRIAKFEDTSYNNEEVRQSKTNIPKHFTEIVQKINGVAPKKNILPDGVIQILRNRFDEQNIDIRQCVHYTYSLMYYMSKSGCITYEGKKYEINKYKSQANYILIRMYPDLHIPKLSATESMILFEVFMDISATFQQLYPNKYAINYAFNIFKTLYILMPNSQKIKEFLRFIFIQKPESFDDKDKKLKNVNDKIHVFEPFIYTPHDIYENEKYYIVK